MATKNQGQNAMEKITAFAKRRGFVFQSSEIYGGFSSCYDFGPLGVELKNNIKKAWWEEMTKKQDGIIGLDSSILMSPKVWQASGHLTAGFADELAECKKCHKRFRLDEILNSKTQNSQSKKAKKYQPEKTVCPECGGPMIEPRKFNLMIKALVGPVQDTLTETYLRAETCQGIYVNFKNIWQSMRLKVPFGVVQVGKSFRNEITPKDFLFRTREFEQMEMQWFCHPKEADKFFDYWLRERIKWLLSLGIKKENLRTVETQKKDLAHYAKRAVDIEYRFPFGFKEIEGVHNRGDWDLSNHSKNSDQDLSCQDDETKEKFIPHIIETSLGADRLFFALLCDAFEEIKGGRTETTESTKEVEIVLKLSKKLSPVKAAVLPLVKNKKAITKKAKEIYRQLKTSFVCQYDESGSIGRRYRRQDEIGTTAALTVDFKTLKDDTVTVRDRDTMKQKRVKISKIEKFIKDGLSNNI